ncbi:MAG: DUF721 domain-containing protein [Spirochaetia bacterium]|jgi:hypothetical protein|nr:DUF721 domain-containing protein [Spirochaetia bacterium]
MDKAGDLLKNFFAFYNIDGGEKYVSLFSSWRKVVGDAIADHSRIFNLRKGALIVEVDHPGWVQMLRMRQEGILQRLSRAYPDLGIRMIHTKLVRSGQFSPPQKKDASPPEPQPPPPPEYPARENGGLENIQDAELRDLLLRLKKTLGNKKQKRKP